MNIACNNQKYGGKTCGGILDDGTFCLVQYHDLTAYIPDFVQCQSSMSTFSMLVMGIPE